MHFAVLRLQKPRPYWSRFEKEFTHVLDSQDGTSCVVKYLCMFITGWVWCLQHHVEYQGPGWKVLLTAKCFAYLLTNYAL